MAFNRFLCFAFLSSLSLTVVQTYNLTSGHLSVHCTPNPCQNGGECVVNPLKANQSFCRCQPQFVGTHCQHPNPCHGANRCLNGGTCITTIASVTNSVTNSAVNSVQMWPQFKCLCPLGFSASLCEMQLSSVCDHNPCLNGGKCQLKNSLNEFQCLCADGWTGHKCAQKDNCVHNTCRNGAKCHSRAHGYTCECQKGFTGDHCTQDVDECAHTEDMCAGNGLCLNTMGGFRCNCNRGFTGQHCRERYIPCEHDRCLNGGHCVPHYQTLSYSCQCPVGYSGINCENNVDDCGGNLCQNGGTCVDGLNTYTCSCPAHWTGPYCSRDVDECAIRPHVCQNGATCVNSLGGFSCICVNGWTGVTCSDNIDDCAAAACFNGATCHDRVGSFYCQCPPGKTGLLCHLDDACASNPCHAGAICDTSPIDGTYMCSCPLGFKGIDCTQDVDECRESGSPCEHGGTCVNTPGSFRCDCALGFAGPRCEVNINECDSSPCLNDGTCLDERGSYRCVCMPGYNGVHCETDVDECASNPCDNNAICTDLINGYRCLCQVGYEGPKCERNLDDCYSNPCLNGGTCRDELGSFSCVCPKGFTGFTCDFNINDCESSPCHRGKCLDKINAFTCVCDPGFTGLLCQSQLKECLSLPCQFGATCHDHINGYSCECASGTTGNNCQYNVNECASNPCFNGGTCEDDINTYLCHCLKGFSGHRCEKETDECASDPCQNSARCIDLHANYQCICPQGFTGRYCEVNVDECARITCQNGGTCLDGVNSFQCTCLSPFTGTYCEASAEVAKADNPWIRCPLAKFCWQHFGDKTCNEECNSIECLFDGFDCRLQRNDMNCNEMYESYCAANYANGHCDSGCNNAECAWDGLDCEDEQRQKEEPVLDIKGDLILQIDAPFSQLTQNTDESKVTLSALLRQLSTIIGSVVRLRQIHPNGTHSTQMVLSVDNRRCGHQCFDSSREIASFLSASQSRDSAGLQALLNSGFRITGIDATDGDQGLAEMPDSPHGLTYVAVAVVIVLVGGAFVGVLVTTNRKKVAKGITWFPEGFFNNNLSGHSARDRHHNNASASAASGEYGRARRRPTGVARTGRPDGQEMHQFKSRDDLIDDKSACAIYEEPMECRTWSHAHYDAYNAEAMTPPLNTPTIDAIGPNGMTPLMVASAFPHHVITVDNPDTCLSDNNAVHDLLMNGANVGLTCDRTHETSLHLAARYARADAAKRLLDSGADCNALDATGRTPLHTAIASDARGVFEILLRNRSTNLNARSNDGTTPLILAARLANEGMLDQLVMSECDLNASDDSGKTALHWAASVNNMDAVRVLLQNGANRDAQNHKEETPLFLAAREGSFQCARILLENHSNRDITDHMDQLPRDVALARTHTDIVALLDEFVAPMPQTITQSSAQNPISPNGRQTTASLRRKATAQARAVPPLPPPRNSLSVAANQLPMTSQMAAYELSPPSRPPPTYEDSLSCKQRQLMQSNQWPQTQCHNIAPPRPPESYLTPSPDSPNTWISSPSTSSPISAHDWLSLQTNHNNDQQSGVGPLMGLSSPPVPTSCPRFAPSSTQQAVFI